MAHWFPPHCFFLQWQVVYISKVKYHWLSYTSCIVIPSEAWRDILLLISNWLPPNSFQVPSATWPSPSSRHGLYFLLKALQLFCYAPKLLIPRQEGRHDKRHLTAYICVVKNLINQLGFSRRMRRRRIHGWRILPAARRCFTIKTLATRRISIAVAPRHLLFFAACESWNAMRGL